MSRHRPPRLPMHGVILGALICAAAVAPTAARAQHAVHSGFWRELRTPGFRRSRELLRQGRALLALAGRERRASHNARLLSAIRRFRLARELAPNDPEALFELGRSKASLRWPTAGGGEELTQADEARALLLELRARFPDYEARRVAFELGVLAAHAQDFPRAAREYERSLEARRVGEGAPSMHANLAEVYMLSGDLERAEEQYRVAIRLARPGRGLALSRFGLAVCLDRRDEPRKALAMVRRAMAAGGGSTDVLRSSGVFFEPAAELHYYEALALRARAEDARARTQRARLLRQAASALRRYLGGVAPETPFYELAARRLESLRRALRSASP
ncbi:MAG: hypothetical protein GXP55_06445 [Deltaproteobacteria bacterium]|nr:hypothetical protein [Deltaproteobacteria bacterium]